MGNFLLRKYIAAQLPLTDERRILAANEASTQVLVLSWGNDHVSVPASMFDGGDGSVPLFLPDSLSPRSTS